MLNCSTKLIEFFSAWRNKTWIESVFEQSVKTVIFDECTVENERSETEWNSQKFCWLSMTFHQIRIVKNYFLFTSTVLDPNINLKEKDQKFAFGGLIGYGNSWMDYFFANSKIFELYAILHDAAGSVKPTTHKGPGYWYVLRRFPSFCFLGHVIGLFFCLYIKTFASTVYALFNC